MPDLTHFFMLATSSATGGLGPVRDLVLIVVAAAGVGMLMGRLGIVAIPGYLVVGAVLGPHALGVVSSGENIALISELALILLMLAIGLHMDVRALRTGMVSIFGIGVLSTIAVTLAGWPIAMGFGLEPAGALVAAMAMSMSSTAVLLGLLQARREVHRAHGRLVVGASIVQDLMSIVFLAFIPALAAGAGAPPSVIQEDMSAVGLDQAAVSTMPLGRMLLSATLAIVVTAAMVVLGRWLLPRVLTEAVRPGSSGGGGSEELVLVSAAIALAAAVLTQLVGIGPAMGAFLAGFLLAGTPFRHQVSGQISPLRDLFMAIFFTTVGLQMDVPAVADAWWVVILGLIAVVALKGALVFVSAWALGASGTVAGLSAILLANAGEFSLVILSQGVASNIIGPQTQAIAIALVVCSLIFAALVYDPAQRLRPWLSRLRPAPWISVASLRETPVVQGEAEGEPKAEAAPALGKIIIAGFGVVGRALADRFEVAGVPFTIIELNAGTVNRQRQLGREAYFGDIANAQVLEAAGIHQAEAVLLTVPDDEAVISACQAIRALAPHVFIAARASYLSTGFRASAAGADHVSVTEIAIAEAMAKQVTQQLEARARAEGRTLRLVDGSGSA